VLGHGAPGAALVVPDHPVALGERRRLQIPHPHASEPTVDQQQRGALALHLVIDRAAFDRQEPVHARMLSSRLCGYRAARMRAVIEERTYARAELPRDLEIQVLDFMRLEWSDAFEGDERFRDRLFDDADAVHFVRAAGRLLVSHA